MEAGEEDTGTTSQAFITNIGTTFQGGMKLVYDDIQSPKGLTLSKTVGLAACSRTSLFAVQNDGSAGAPSYSLHYSNDGGSTWTLSKALPLGPELACDHSRLVTLDPNGIPFIARTNTKGVLGPWIVQPIPGAYVDRIQGGDGTLYGVVLGTGGAPNKLYVATNYSTGASEVRWSGPIAGIGATLVTGTGTTATGTDKRPVGNTLAWSRRAFALQPDGSLYMNDRILDGNNAWASLYTGSERFTVITAAAPNLLFGLEKKAGAVHLVSVTMSETSCGDGVDNDGDGLVDGEDAACTDVVAQNFCTTHAKGTYCADRYLPGLFLGQSNQNASMLACAPDTTGAMKATVKVGVCVRNANPAIANNDRQPSVAELTQADLPQTGHYCSVLRPDNTWAFDWEGESPCDPYLMANDGSKIVRAGIYSKTGANNILVTCNDHAPIPLGNIGTAALVAANNVVAHGANACVFTVAPASLPVFSKAFDSAQQLPYPRVAGAFHHSKEPVALAQFGNHETGAQVVDREGSGDGADWRESAYDLPLDEGAPLYALAGGVVLPNGSRDRDVSLNNTCLGGDNQGELYVKYAVGKNEDYQETFVGYYAHVRRRMVVDGQTVKAGQIIGYVGMTGCAGGGAHLHLGMFRTSNNNAHTALAPELGYHQPFVINGNQSGNNVFNYNAIDPLGWAAPQGFDPWAYLYYATYADKADSGYSGRGAWSIALFKNGEAPAYPFRIALP